MISNLLNQANRFFRYSEANSPQYYAFNFNKIALGISILMYGFSLVYLLTLLRKDIPGHISEPATNNFLINRSMSGWKCDIF